MADIVQPHVLNGFGRQRRAPPRPAIKHEGLAGREDVLVIWAFRVDPEFNHPPGRMEGIGNHALMVQFPDIAQVDEHMVVAVQQADGFCHRDRLDTGFGLFDHLLDGSFQCHVHCS